jgi:hypothetical protein
MGPRGDRTIPGVTSRSQRWTMFRRSAPRPIGHGGAADRTIRHIRIARRVSRPFRPGTPTAGWRRLNRPTAPLGGRPGRISWSTRTPGWGRTHRTTAARTAYAPGQRRIGRFGAHPGAPPQSTSNEPQASPWRTLADLRCLAISSDTASATHRTVAHRADRSLGAAETPLRGNSEWPMVNPDECQTTRSEHPYGAGH